MLGSSGALDLTFASRGLGWVGSECQIRSTSVMIEKFACAGGKVWSEFLDLNHTGRAMILVSPMIAKFARDPGIEHRRTSQSGH